VVRRLLIRGVFLPTSLTGLLFFVVLLLPGFAYLVGKERHGTERHTSPFRETIAVVAASITSELVVLAAFALVRWLLPSQTPDVGALIGLGARAYVAGHVGLLAGFGLIMLSAAVGLAYVATVPGVRRCFVRVPVVGTYPHDSTVSSWWLLFEKWPEISKSVPVGNKGKARKIRVKRTAEVGCLLEDGSYLRGELASFNNSANDSPDRDLVLKAPLEYRPPGARELMPHPGVSAVSIPASRIVSLFVGYVDPAGP